MIHIWKCTNGKVEFKNRVSFMRYLSGEKPELKLNKKTGRYKATFN